MLLGSAANNQGHPSSEDAKLKSPLDSTALEVGLGPDSHQAPPPLKSGSEMSSVAAPGMMPCCFYYKVTYRKQVTEECAPGLDPGNLVLNATLTASTLLLTSPHLLAAGSPAAASLPQPTLGTVNNARGEPEAALLPALTSKPEGTGEVRGKRCSPHGSAVPAQDQTCRGGLGAHSPRGAVLRVPAVEPGRSRAPAAPSPCQEPRRLSRQVLEKALQCGSDSGDFQVIKNTANSTQSLVNYFEDKKETRQRSRALVRPTNSKLSAPH